MAGIRINGTAKLRTRLKRAIGPEVEAAFRRAAAIIEGDLKRNSLTARRRPDGLLRGGGIGGLAVNTGQVRASISTRLFGFKAEGKNQVVAIVGSPIAWLPIHEYGGVIRGRPWLAIPTIYARRYAGRPTALWRSKRGTLFVWALLARGMAKPVKMLLRSVVMPARRPFAKSLQRVGAQVREVMGGLGRALVRM